MAKPGPHPEPPGDIHSRSPLAKSELGDWYRIYPIGKDPIYFGMTGDNRFDSFAHDFGVLYIGEDPHCAFIETYGHGTGINTITMNELERRGLAKIWSNRPLKLIDLCAEGALARLGADAQLTSGEHEVAQRWSDAFHNHPAKYDGLRYFARHDPTRVSYALFERVEDALMVEELGSLAESHHASLLADILNTYDFGLIRS